VTATWVLVVGSLIAGILIGGTLVDNLHFRRSRQRRRRQIAVHGRDAVECWLETVERAQQHPTNGTPFEGDEVA
jgi:hypothetical protein